MCTLFLPLTGELVSIDSLRSSVICTPRDLVLLTNCTVLPWRLSGVRTVLPLEGNSDFFWFVDIRWQVTVVTPEHSPSCSIHHASYFISGISLWRWGLLHLRYYEPSPHSQCDQKHWTPRLSKSIVRWSSIKPPERSQIVCGVEHQIFLYFNNFKCFLCSVKIILVPLLPWPVKLWTQIDPW